MQDNESDRGKRDGPVFPDGKTQRPTKVTIADIAELRKIFEDSKLAKWVVLAGVGGIVELIRLLYDIAKYCHTKGIF
jgi:hypothetical protein